MEAPKRNDPCFCGSGLKYKKCCGRQFPIHPDSLIGRLIRLYRTIDNIAVEIKNSRKLPCRLGCSQCCRTMFDISAIEFNYIKYGLSHYPTKYLFRLKRNVFSVGKHVAEKYPKVFQDINVQEPPTLTRVEYELLAIYREQVLLEVGEIPCPFLDDNICTIYQYRPFVCRVTGIFRHPSGEPTCNIIKQEDLQRQEILPSKLNIIAALGFAPLGKPLLVWLYNAINKNSLLVFTDEQIKTSFTHPASQVTVRGVPIPPSSLNTS